MKKIRYLPPNGLGKYGPKPLWPLPLWPDVLIKRIIGDVEPAKPNYQKLYRIPSTLITNKYI